MRTEESMANTGMFGLDERCCALDDSVCFLRQLYPIFSLMTYDREQNRYAEHTILCKTVTGTGEDSPEWIDYQSCTDETHGENIPGGLKSYTFLNDGRYFTAEMYPLHKGAVFHLKSETESRFWFKLGAGQYSFMHFSPNPAMTGTGIDCTGTSVQIIDNTVLITRNDRKVITAVSGSFISKETVKKENGSYAEVSLRGKDIYLVFGFSDDESEAVSLSKRDGPEEECKISEHYAKLIERWKLKTPVPELNEAFTHALLNVEYSWLEPYGWIESIQHWPTMWHMEQTAHEEWNGHYERVKTCLRTQMKNVFENGAIPDMCPTGDRRRDWGGNNQFFIREVIHYVKMTGDIDFLREAEPYMENALKQSIREYDATGSGVLCWYRQIGNQEDMEATPGMGAATGAAGIQMMKELSYAKKLLGKDEESEQYRLTAEKAAKVWYDHLWLRDLGRPAWYEDITGSLHLDTTYHGICYPVMFGLIDEYDAYSSLDHMLHRMSGPEGEVYQTNHFGDHCYSGVPTWGMQAGSDMQPFATFALSGSGRNNDAYRPLEFIAKRVCGPYQRGSWPETANELRFAYFSPSAAMYSQGIIEGIFGIHKDIPSGVTYISPSVPDDWKRAALDIPGNKITLNRVKNGMRIRFDIKKGGNKIIRMAIPQSSSYTVSAGGRLWNLRPEQYPGYSVINYEAGFSYKGDITVAWTPVNACAFCDDVAAEGDSLEITVPEGLRITGIYDKYGVFSDYSLADNKATCTVKGELLKEYEKYGQFGLLNDARRSFFVKLLSEDTEFIVPKTVTVIPAYRVTASFVHEEDRFFVKCLFENNSRKAYRGPWKIMLNDVLLSAVSDNNIGSAITKELSFEVTRDEYAKADLVPGKNRITLSGSETVSTYADVYGDILREIEALTLPEALIKPKDYWKELGNLYARGCLIQNADAYLNGFYDAPVTLDFGGTLKFKADERGFIPFNREKHPVVTIDLGGRKMRKLFVAISAFIENEDVFTDIVRIEAEAVKGESLVRPVFHKELYFPGDLDMGFGNDVIAGFATYVPGTDRTAKPSFPRRGEDKDYTDIMPPVYPERKYWCDSKVFQTHNAVFNLIEIDLNKEREMKEMRIIANTADSAGGIFAVGYCR